MKRRNNLSWLDATKLVLSTSEDAMCQTQILQKISELGLKDTNVPNSGEMVMRALLANSAGKNPIITKVEDKKFVINANYKATAFTHDTTSINKRQLPQRKKTKTISDDFVDSDSLVHEREEKVSYSPYSSHTFDHVRKNKRMRIRPTVTLPKVQVRPAILLKDCVNSAAQPKLRSRAAVQDMFNGNSDIMKYDVIARKCINMEEFSSLSKCQQRYLASLLPSSDVRKERNNVKLQPTALSNPFFASFFREWQDKLGKGELSVEFANKVKLEAEKQVAKNPWKETFFEDVWGFARAEQAKNAQTNQRERRDTFEDTLNFALTLIPPTFFIPPAPVIDPIQESLTPPTSDGSEHDRSHTTNTDLMEEKDLQILTPDHEMDQSSEKLPPLHEMEKIPPLVLDHHDSERSEVSKAEDLVVSEDQVSQRQESAVPDVSEQSESDTSGLLEHSIEFRSEIPEQPPSPAFETFCASEIHETSAVPDSVGPLEDDMTDDVNLKSYETPNLYSKPDNSEPSESNVHLESTDQESTERFEWNNEPLSPVAGSESDCLDKRKSAEFVDTPCSPIIDQGSPTIDQGSPTVDPGSPTVDLGSPTAPTVDPGSPILDTDCPKVDPEPSKQPNYPIVPREESLDHELSFPELDLEDQILTEFEQPTKEDIFPVIDDPELTCDFISDKSCEIKPEKLDEPAHSIKSMEEPTLKTVTKLTVSDDISLNIMSDEFKMPSKSKISDMKLDLSDIPNPLTGYNSPTSSGSSASSPRTDTERRERLTLKILKKDLILPPEPYPVKHKKSKKHRSRHHKTSKSLGVSSTNSSSSCSSSSSSSITNNIITTFPQQHFTLDSSNQYSIFKEDESEQDLNLKRISLQQQHLAEKGIKCSSIPIESTKNLVKNMREKQQQCQALPKLTKAPMEHQPMVVLDSGSQRMYPHKSIPIIKDLKYCKQLDPRSSHPLYNRSDSSESIRSALKAKINQRRYTDIPINLDEPPPQYTALSSGNHCCYVVKGSPDECVCSTAPMLFCTKCYHLSHSSCSNVLCSNCGALFKFN